MKKNGMGKHAWSCVSVLVFLAGLWFCIKPLFFSTYYPDFSSYYYGAQYASNDQNPYNGGSQFFTPFVYPPTMLLFSYPLTTMPYQSAEKIFTAGSILLYMASLIILGKLFFASVSWQWKLLSLGILFSSYFPSKFTIGMGQINMVVLFFCVLLLIAARHKKDRESGIILAILVSIKLFPLPLIFILILEKKWTIIKSFFIASVLLWGISFIAVGQTIIQTFFTETLPHLLLSPKTDYYNQSLLGMISRLIMDEDIRSVMLIVYTALPMIILLSLTSIPKEKRSLFYSFSFVTTLLVQTFSWQHHFVLLLPSYAILLSFIYNNRLPYIGVLTLCSYIMTAINIPSPDTTAIVFWSHGTIGLLILWGVSLYTLLSPYSVVQTSRKTYK